MIYNVFLERSGPVWSCADPTYFWTILECGFTLHALCRIIHGITQCIYSDPFVVFNQPNKSYLPLVVALHWLPACWCCDNSIYIHHSFPQDCLWWICTTLFKYYDSAPFLNLASSGLWLLAIVFVFLSTKRRVGNALFGPGSEVEWLSLVMCTTAILNYYPNVGFG